MANVDFPHKALPVEAGTKEFWFHKVVSILDRAWCTYGEAHGVTTVDPVNPLDQRIGRLYSDMANGEWLEDN